MGRENKKERIRDRGRKEGPMMIGDTVRMDCPCPNTDCKNHTVCEPCRYKHRKGKPYCERDDASNQQ